MCVSPRRLLVVALMGSMALFTTMTPAQAALTLRLSSGNFSDEASAPSSSPNSLNYTNNSFGGLFRIESLGEKSNSSSDGPVKFSQLDSRSFDIENLSAESQILTISLSDTGFDPNSEIRPLWIYNSASLAFSQLTGGKLTFQTFAYDGNDLFRTSGEGVVSTAPVIITPMAGGSTTTAPFSPIAQFSLTNVMTVELAGGASISGFIANSIVHAPEPGSVTLALSAMPLLGVVVLRRRRATRPD